MDQASRALRWGSCCWYSRRAVLAQQSAADVTVQGSRSTASEHCCDCHSPHSNPYKGCPTSWQVVGKYGKVDVLILNAAIQASGVSRLERRRLLAAAYVSCPLAASRAALLEVEGELRTLVLQARANAANCMSARPMCLAAKRADATSQHCCSTLYLPSMRRPPRFWRTPSVSGKVAPACLPALRWLPPLLLPPPQLPLLGLPLQVSTWCCKASVPLRRCYPSPGCHPSFAAGTNIFPMFYLTKHAVSWDR